MADLFSLLLRLIHYQEVWLGDSQSNQLYHKISFADSLERERKKETKQTKKEVADCIGGQYTCSSKKTSIRKQ